MKIAIFVNNHSPEGGGSYTFESQLLEAILRLAAHSKHTIVLYTWEQSIAEHLSSPPTVKGVSLYRPLNQRIAVKIIRLGKAIFDRLMHPLSQVKVDKWQEKHILSALKKEQIDLILSLVPSCPTLDYPYIMPVWDLQHRLQPYFPEVSAGNEWDGRENAYAKTLRRATFIITGTEVGKAEVEKFYQVPSERIKVIPFFTPQVQTNTKINDESILAKYHISSPYIFYPAQFWSHKNHINLLLAIKLLKEQYNLELNLVLTGSDKGNKLYVQEVVKTLDLSKQVHFLGFVSREEISCLYRNALALTFMSFFGPDNLPPLEAMALGCPVIASNVSGAEEQLGSAALLVNPKCPEEIAMAIHSLLDKPELRQELIKSGFARSSQWTADDYTKQIFSLIDDFAAIRNCW